MTVARVDDLRLLDVRDDSIGRVYALFREILGQSNVEDIDAFYATTSPYTDAAIVPKVVGAFEDGDIIGASLGLYLRKLDAGIVIYAGVRETFRGRGVYTKVRNLLLAELAEC